MDEGCWDGYWKDEWMKDVGMATGRMNELISVTKFLAALCIQLTFDKTFPYSHSYFLFILPVFYISLFSQLFFFFSYSSVNLNSYFFISYLNDLHFFLLLNLFLFTYSKLWVLYASDIILSHICMSFLYIFLIIYLSFQYHLISFSSFLLVLVVLSL